MKNEMEVILTMATPGPYHVCRDNPLVVKAGSRNIASFSSKYDAIMFVKMHEVLTGMNEISSIELKEAREAIDDLESINREYEKMLSEKGLI